MSAWLGYKRSKELERITEWFIKPFIKKYMENAPDASYEEAIAAWFHVDTRTIDTYQALEEFVIPGSLRWYGFRSLHGTPKPVIKPGDLFLIRHDLTRPEWYGLQFREDCFNLTKEQFKTIERKIKRVDGK